LPDASEEPAGRRVRSAGKAPEQRTRDENEESVSTVLEYLTGLGAPFLVLPRAGSRTPAEGAIASGVEPTELIRTEVVIAESGPALTVVPAGRPLDPDMLRVALDDPQARPATDDEAHAVTYGCEPGRVPPLGMWLRLPMYVDTDVARLQRIVFPIGTSALVRMRRADLFRGDPYIVAPLTPGSLPAEPALRLQEITA
jgi:prolyl-tRNA editing enzyme YbaK/EbsC (Cys-tRNA(Pro) deacylase)